MKVYALMGRLDYEDHEVVAIYANKATADSKVASLKAWHKSHPTSFDYRNYKPGEVRSRELLEAYHAEVDVWKKACPIAKSAYHDRWDVEEYEVLEDDE